MKFLDRLILKLFSLIILVTCIFVVLYIVGIVPVESVENELAKLTDVSENTIKIILVVDAVLALLSLKGLFFASRPDVTSRKGIVLENSKGKLVISKESLDNIISSTVREVTGAESVSSKTLLDKNRNLIVYVSILVRNGVAFKEVSVEIQNKIAEALKATADLDVKSVHVEIRNVSSKKVKKVKEDNKVVEEPTTELTINDNEESQTDNNQEEA